MKDNIIKKVIKSFEKKFEKNLEGEEKRSIFAVPFGKEVT